MSDVYTGMTGKETEMTAWVSFSRKWESNKVFGFFVLVFIVGSATIVNATLINNIIDTTVIGLYAWTHGGTSSDGYRLVVGGDTENNSATYASVYIFNPLPPSGAIPINVNTADAEITGFARAVSAPIPSPCIVGDKLLVGDSDPVFGYCIKIWNQVPTADTVAGSYNCKITGFSSYVYDFRTDGTKFLANSGKIWIWNSVPASDTTCTGSAYASCTDPGYARGCWLGSSGQFYLPHSQADSRYYVSVFNPIPAGSFGINSRKFVISFSSIWAYHHAIMEMRDYLYLFAQKISDNKLHIYVWKNIPDTNTDLSNINGECLTNLSFSYGRVTADTAGNFFLWDSAQGAIVNVITHKYDVTVTGTDAAVQSIYRKQQDLIFEKVRVYTYPGSPTLTTLTLKKTGAGSETHIQLVKIYDDYDKNGQYDSAVDVLVCTGVYSSETLVISNINFPITSGDKTLLVCYDISENAPTGVTLGVNVLGIIFENNYCETTPYIVSSLSTLSDYAGVSWNNQLRLVSTQRQTNGDTLYSISLDWDDPTSGMSPFVYKLSHYIDGNLTEETYVYSSSCIVYNLDSSKTHRFKVKVRDFYGQESQESDFASDEVSPVWDKTFKVYDVSRTNANGEWEYRIRITWNSGSDSTTKDILYEISIKEQGKDWSVKGTTWDNAFEISGLSGTVYLKIRAWDVAGNYTGYTEEKVLLLNPFLSFYEEKTVGKSGGEIELTDIEGEKLEIEIPEGALKKDYRIGAEKLRESEYTYKFSVLDENGKEKRVLFGKPVTIKFHYSDDKILRLGYEEDNLIISYFDDVKWVSIGGIVKKDENTVQAGVYHFSKYKLLGTKEKSNQIILSSEIITPNDDEINDYLNFYINWNYYGNASIRVFDLSGKLVWEYNGSDKTVTWNCRTGNDQVAESGVYIYVIRVEGMNYTGEVVIAR